MSLLSHLSFIQNLSKRFYVIQLEAFFTWLQATKDAQHGSVFINLPPATFHVDKNKKPISTLDGPAFIICTPLTKEDAFTTAMIVKRQDWHPIFTTPTIEIWENISHFIFKNRPLRFGLDLNEKEFLITTIRSYLGNIISNIPVAKKPLIPLSARLLEHTDLDVTMWTNGKLRGSIILQNQPLINGLKEAALRATTDHRFKPLASNELAHTAIEINLISTLHIPITEKEVLANNIYTNKTYRAQINQAQGWYTPAVFNCRTFSDLKTFTESLIIEKIGHKITKPLPIYTISHTENFISLSETSNQILNLNGPLPESTTLSLTELKQATARYLGLIQETDGNLPAIINPMQGEQSVFDSVRLAHSIWALNHNARVTADQKTRQVAAKAYEYLKTLLKQPGYLKFLQPYQKALMLVYMHHASVILADSPLSTFITDLILEIDETLLPTEPILFLQLAQWHFQTFTSISKAEKYITPILRSFEEKIAKKQSFELASYIDLIPSLRTLGTITSNPILLKKADEITDWYYEEQLSIGSFPSFHGSNYSYTRGTIKILETLSQIVKLDKLKFLPLNWLTSMQYTTNTTYFVKPELQTKILGGFRHDAHNASVWIDASSHLLLINS